MVISNLLPAIHKDDVCQLFQDKVLHLANISGRFVDNKLTGHTVDE